MSKQTKLTNKLNEINKLHKAIIFLVFGIDMAQYQVSFFINQLVSKSINSKLCSILFCGGSAKYTESASF